MNFVAIKMLTGDRAKYLGLIFAIAFSTFLLENQSSIFAGIMKRTTSQILLIITESVDPFLRRSWSLRRADAPASSLHNACR